MLLPLELKLKIDKAIKRHVERETAYLICEILVKRKYLHKHVPLPKKQLTKLISYKKYAKILRLLTKINIIEKDYYEPGKKSYYYKLKNNYQDVVNIKLNTANARSISKKQKDIQKTKTNKLPAYLKQMLIAIRELQWDSDEMRKIVDEYNPTNKDLEQSNSKRKHVISMDSYKKELKEAMLYSIARLEHKEFNFSRDETSLRLHTNITNLKGVLYKSTKTCLTEIDIANSQPYFLAVLLRKLQNKILDTSDNNELNTIIRTIISDKFNYGFKKIFESNVFKSELNILEDMTTSGKFYEKFMSKFNMERKEVKTLMFKILFSQNNSYRESKIIFSNYFPMINQVIENIKEENHNTLAILLQRMESFIMIDKVSKQLVEKHKIIPITKHDSIAVKPEYVEIATDVLQKTFRENGSKLPYLQVQTF